MFLVVMMTKNKCKSASHLEVLCIAINKMPHSFIYFIIILLLCWEYFVTFTKVLQYILVKFTPSTILFYPSSPLLE
jgi:hypothetical protein